MDTFDLYPEFKNPFVGRPLAYKPIELAEKFIEYIEWAKNHPIATTDSEEGYKAGKSTDVVVTRMKPRLISIEGFLVYIGKTKRWWGELDNGRLGAQFSALKQCVREYCESYQTEMASTGLFNANIISRLLGLAEKQEIDANIKGVTINVTSQESAQVLQDIIDKDKTGN